MPRCGDQESEERFAAFVAALVDVIGHADRASPLRDYCTGLLMPAERKSVEPMAAITAPARVAAQHQSLLHFVGQSAWSDEAILTKVRALTLPALERSGPVEAWIIDDTSFPKKGQHSVGVTRQYCGQLGKQDNCQVAVSVSVANEAASLPVAYRLYLPQDWAADPVRRRKAGVPESVTFQTKPEIALDQIRAAVAAEIPPGVVLMDAGYGADTALRTGVSALGMAYVAGVQPHTSVWTRSNPPPQIKPWSGRGRPPTRLRRDPHRQPQSAQEIALALPNTGSPPFPRTSPSTASSRLPSCAGGSSATTRSSSRNSGWGTMRGAAGAGSITTPPCASQLTPSSSPSGRRFPPQDERQPSARRLAFPPVIDPAALPIRPERHLPNSIPTVRRRRWVCGWLAVGSTSR